MATTQQIFRFDEMPDSRFETTRPASLTLKYRATGIQEELAVHAHALGATPVTLIRNTAILYRQDIQMEPDGWANYIITVPYGPLTREPNQVSFSFDTTGATINIKAAKQHVASYGASGVITGDWHRGAIGVKQDGEVEGVDIVIPALKMTYKFKHPQGALNEAQARANARITGTMNAGAFRGFDPGELLFLGASGSDGTDQEAEVAYQFAASGNSTNLTIGDIAGIAKRGHDVAWVEFGDGVENGAPVRRPERVHIDRVYDLIDFPAVFGWG